MLPETPGVYMYYDAEGTVIYVGKAKNLKRRVSSYFNRTHEVLRTNILVRNIVDMSYIVVPTEADALNLENSMIKEYKPRYNVLLKDDKSYPWICLTKEMFPRVFLTRQRLRDGSKYYGPYTDAGAARTVLSLIRDLYPIRGCRIPITPASLARGKGRLCLEYHLKRCQGCCVGAVSEETYGEYIENIKQILRGETGTLLQHLRDEMQRLSMELRFEEAQVLKEQYQKVERYQAKSVIVNPTLDDVDVFGIDDDGSNDVYINYMHVRRGAVSCSLTLRYKRRLEESRSQLLSYAMQEIRQRFQVSFEEAILSEHPDMEFPGLVVTIPQRGDKFKLLEVSAKNARQSRIDDLKHLEKVDPEKRSMKTLERPDDFASMKEVLTRRYTRLMEEAPDDLPQLVVVDGGKGQLSSAVEALDEIGLRGKIALVGIAKRLEEIYFPGDSVPLYIDKNSESLKVVQHLRDEAHRFGITHHRDRRSKSQIVSELSQIAGIGPATEEALLSKFKSAKRIAEAPFEAIAEVIGPAKAKLIVNYYSTGRQK
jgi:excinuclease ABC subunit C